MNIDDEIKQDFLVEAGELYDLLNDQLSELEKNPQDEELLNAIFRAFHTIKGGAGFLELVPMVEICHRAEDVFDLLRKEQVELDSSLINVFFEALDILGDMFENLREDEALPEADPHLLHQLDTYLNVDVANADAPVEVSETAPESSIDIPEEADQAESPQTMDDEFEQMRLSALAAKKPVTSPPASSDLITEDEFDNLLDEIHGKGKHSAATPAAEVAQKKSDLITDDEFDDLLDEIHGKGKHSAATPVAAVAQKKSDLITDDEFDAMMDQMHGKNKGPGTLAAKPVAAVEKHEKVEPQEPTVSVSNTADKKPAKKIESSVRVDTERLDDIMNLVGELVLVRNRLSMLKQTMKQDNVSEAITTLELVTTDLQSSVMKTRMQPIKKVFGRFPRVIRDLAKKLNKDINLELVGEETGLDKSLVEALADPLIHLVRNSADHGIELPEERFSVGKARQGTITLSAQQEGDQILLTVTDDGKGMDHEAFRRKAVEAGMMNQDSANNLSNKDAYNLIFAPGFSTKTEISDVSGRGVGMDVVKTRINELNGSIEIDSTLGKGSVITIHLPLTLAILPTLMVMLDTYQFALPLNNVYEAFNMEPDKINIVDGQEVMQVRGETLPLFYLYPWLVRNNVFAGPDLAQKVIVVQMGSLRFCLVVDKIVGQEEVVIKPLGAMLHSTAGFSGATITGDGNIALVLDVPSLMSQYTTNCVAC